MKDQEKSIVDVDGNRLARSVCILDSENAQSYS